MPTKTKRKRKTLAHVKKLSQLLDIGLRDLHKQERAKNSVVDMGDWLRQNGTCTACLAGSVMRFTLGCRSHGASEPYTYPTLTYRALMALNFLRSGNVLDAAQRMSFETKLCDRHIPAYDGPSGMFWKAMEQLHSDLEAAGE